MRIRFAAFCLFSAGFIGSPVVEAGNQPGKVFAVLDGDTVSAVGVDASGAAAGKPGTLGIRGICAPAVDQPFGSQARKRLQELVEGKGVS